MIAHVHITIPLRQDSMGYPDGFFGNWWDDLWVQGHLFSPDWVNDSLLSVSHFPSLAIRQQYHQRIIKCSHAIGSLAISESNGDRLRQSQHQMPTRNLFFFKRRRVCPLGCNP